MTRFPHKTNTSPNRKLFLVAIDCFFLFFSAALITSLLFLDSYLSETVFCVPLLAHFALLFLFVEFSRFCFRTYVGIWRYAEEGEYIRLAIADGCGFAVFLFIEILLSSLSIGWFYSIPLLLYHAAIFMLSLLLVIGSRLFYGGVITKKRIEKKKVGKTAVAIVGAGFTGTVLANQLLHDENSTYSPYCFFDDDINKLGRYIHGIPVKGRVDQIGQILQNTPVKEIIIAIPSLSEKGKQHIVNVCLAASLQVKTFAFNLDSDNSGSISATKTLSNLKITDLLHRDQKQFDNTELTDFYQDRTLMVTGGGGSIGAELCRQLAAMSPRRLVVVDIYENNAYDLQQELLEKNPRLKLSVEIASVRDKKKIFALVNKYRPDYVFHAAAHKHVPLMEDCCDEAVKNNIFGTHNVALACDRYHVKKMVLISTDKAVNPTNMMGASKRVCEMVMQSMHESRTVFSAVRFGNVLGSNGSVIPLFQRQIEKGGPITITDKRIIRYFMTIPEAVQLVLRTGCFAQNSQIFVLDMGKPVKILDLAEKLITLSGYRPYEDIDIIEIGLRPGEKLYEELLIKGNNLSKTENDMIFIENEPPISKETLNSTLDNLREALESDAPFAVRDALMAAVPTYRTPEIVNKDFAGAPKA